MLEEPEAIARVTVSPAFGAVGVLGAGEGVMYWISGVGVAVGASVAKYGGWVLTGRWLGLNR